MVAPVEGLAPAALAQLVVGSSLPPVHQAVRAALDKLAPTNGDAVTFGPGRWVPANHLDDRYAVQGGEGNWGRTEQ